jgi:putative drug exporter of the RND superfamily
MVAWVLVIVFLGPFANGLSNATNDSVSAYLPASAPSTKVTELQSAAEHKAGNPVSEQAVVVFASDSRLSAADLTAIASARTAVAGLVGRVSGLGAPSKPQPSPDGKAAEFSLNVVAAASNLTSIDTTAVQRIRHVVGAPAAQAGDGLQVAVTGLAATTADGGNQTQTGLLLAAIVIVAIVLLLVYRSPLLWILPLLGAVGAIVVAEAGARGLISAGFTVSPLSASILIVLVFGAASDYALLLTHRYREELRHHAAAEEAMAVALRRTLPTLVASAATVVCAMLCLLAARSAALHGLGPVGAVSIAAALLAQVTFLPALLLVVGRVGFWPRVPREGQAGGEKSRVWAGIGARVSRNPAWTTVVAVVLLGAACAGLLTLRADNNPVDNLKGHPGSVVGAQLLAKHYTAGAESPLVILAPKSEAAAALTAVRSTAGIAGAAPAPSVGSYAQYQAIMSVPPYGGRGTSLIKDLRGRLARDAPGSLVGGYPAVEYDSAQAARRDSLILIPLVLVVITLIIGVLLRAIIAPLVLVATTAVSFAAAFGLSSLLWRYGFGYHGVDPTIPLYIFVFLVALGVDYNIFLSARIREETWRTGMREGTLHALSVTGGVITAAGIVLAATFAALAQLPTVQLTEVGTAVALGVLLDTLFVRTVLVPALFLVIGKHIWWPARLGASGPSTKRSAQDTRAVTS